MAQRSSLSGRSPFCQLNICENLSLKQPSKPGARDLTILLRLRNAGSCQLQESTAGFRAKHQRWLVWVVAAIWKAKDDEASRSSFSADDDYGALRRDRKDIGWRNHLVSFWVFEGSGLAEVAWNWRCRQRSPDGVDPSDGFFNPRIAGGLGIDQRTQTRNCFISSAQICGLCMERPDRRSSAPHVMQEGDYFGGNLVLMHL